MKKIKHGVIGLGFFGEYHADVVCSTAQMELTAVCTRRQQRLDEVAAKYNAAKKYTDYRDLLGDPEIDSVSIVTHFCDHKDIAVEALKAGKHVLLEKPMADSVADCDAILEAAAKATGIFMVGHICRFDPRVALAKEAVDQGRVGKIVYMYARRNLSFQIGREVLDKVSPLFGDGIHDTDIMLWLSGAKVNTAYAQNVQIGDFKYPAIGTATYRFDNNAVGVIETVWALPENTPFTIDARMEIIGTEGAIYIDCGNAGLTINDQDGISKPDTGYWPRVHGTLVGALRNELVYFADCISKGEKPTVIIPQESRQAVAVICAAEESAQSGKVVELE
ncbi:MAG: Gfo/Idh/MocA family oxidoreductase [Actinobacteria bacterium]|nr:Gfo/Idh/MocA family oxidoreductase [Actinomycetota bacterium]